MSASPTPSASAPATPTWREAEAVLQELAALRVAVAAEGVPPDDVHPAFRESAQNLLHYLALRRRDLRPLQHRLAALGLSSLGRAEPHVLATLDAVLVALRRLAGRPDAPPTTTGLGFAEGQRLLAVHTDALLGPAPADRDVRIMVTMPSEAADDPALVRDLLGRGMDAMRINGAHDDEATWARMIGHLRAAERACGRSCRVVMDLAGPKLRTGPLTPGQAVVKVRPHRDSLGRVVAPARVWLAPDSAVPPGPADAVLPVPPAWLVRLQRGDRVTFSDARDKARALMVTSTTDVGAWAEATRTAYIVSGIVLRRGSRGADAAAVGVLPAREGRLRLAVGDRLVLTRDLAPGRPASDDGREPARIGCTLPAMFDDARAGEPIWFDDGTIGGVVEAVASGDVRVAITHARPGGRTLRVGKGINLPESALRLAALTDADLAALPFVARHADAVGLSFANRPEDVDALRQRLAALTDAPPPAVVVKVETRRGFEVLPALLLAAMRAPACGVMIARGDLAVECGFERLAEVQEEILWLCEAAHVPVIWATQVLESLARDGTPSRAEVTDAAMGTRAECVMLNKGPAVREAVEALDDILRRMRDHQTKKRAELRELRLAHALTDATDGDGGL